MLSSPCDTPRLLRFLCVTLWLAALGCSKDQASAKPGAQRTQGGESALDRAGHRIEEAHEQFKHDVKPAAQVVDEKSKVVVDEGKKGVNKVVRAIDGNKSDSAQPKAEPKAKPESGDK
jgi:hypothetical protein